MNTITDIPGKLECSCGANAEPKDRKRFLKRHPSMCSERREFTRKVAQGTRCVDDDEAIGARWDALERALGGNPR